MNKSETEQILKKIAMLKSNIQKLGNSGQVELYKKKMKKVSKYFNRVINFLEKEK
ncbi:MAG: hypothetical protein ACJ0G5_05320 [Alphaproteobacteria bacterium]|tara:strand:- start:277 stop:441 length:165 start_codon:yes stop_codon:yes gene_type:complete